MSWLDKSWVRTAGQSIRSVVLDRDRLRAVFTYNVPLKLLSILIAFSLWMFVNFGERDTEEGFRVALELRNIPAHLMITSPRVDFIDIRVSGPRTLLGRIDRSRLSVPLDLGGVRPGPAVFRVGAESLNLPRGVKLVRINPAQVTLELERMAHKSVPVHLRLVGKLPPDLQIVDTKVSPETVQVTGPASDVEDIHAASTEAVDVSSATVGTVERELPLEVTGDYLSYSASRVAAQIRLEQVSVTREFKHVEVTLRGDGDQRYRVTPDHVRLVVRGPKQLVNNLELDPGAVYIDTPNDGVASQLVKPDVDLPTGIELVTCDPEKVQVVAAKKGKRSREGRR